MTKSVKKVVCDIFAIVTGALLMGFLWRVRGESGWGSSWGLLNAGFVFTMYIMAVKGERKKMDLGWLSLTALSFMLTVPAWGTLLSQITGVLQKADPAVPGSEPVYVSVASAVILMLCLSFGVATLFGVMLGRGFSNKQWKLKDFIIVIAVFFISGAIANASLSHWILDLIQPQAADLFEKGLAAASVEGDAYSVYMQHFNNISWAKKFDGGRNYFSSVQTISSAIRAICSLIAVRFIVKDKVSAKTGAVVSAAFAFSITVSDLFFYFGNGGYHMENPSPFPESIYPWGCWEYFTGFFAGAIITAFLLKLRKAEDVIEPTFAKVPAKAENILTFVLFSVFMIGVNIVRPVLVRYEDSDSIIIATVIAVVVAIAAVVFMNVKWGFNMQKISRRGLYGMLFTAFIIYILIIYMFVGIPEKQNYTDLFSLQTIMCIVSVAVTFVWSALHVRAK